jgi:phosphatidylglycerophosphate synthase
MPLSWYFTRFRGWELWLWKACNRGRGVDDTLANSVTIFRAKVSLYAGLTAYLVFAVTREPILLKVAISAMVLSGFLDLVDGLIARWFGTSESGKRLDPAADFTNSLVAFVVILGEHRFEPWLVTFVVVVTVLGGFIFALRVASGVETHRMARVAIATMYIGGAAFFVEIATLQGILFEKTDPRWFVGINMGYTLFFAGTMLMVVSTAIYTWRAWPKVHLRPIGIGVHQLT